MTGTELRLSCAQPGDQIAIFGEALQEIAARSAHLYRDGDNYWYSPQPTLNKLAADRSRDVSEEQADQRIIQVLRDEQRGRAGFPRVHAAPENPTDIDDRRSSALIILPPSAIHDTTAGPKSEGAVAASETLERRGSGQRRYRNALIFVAADSSNVQAARENARRERAWNSILKDRDLQQNLTQAQAEDVRQQVSRSLESLRQSVRGTWVHVLYPAPPDEGDGGAHGGTGYVIRSTRIVNRGGAKNIPQAVWDKVSTDGTVIGEMGPSNLTQSLEPIWPENRNHIPIKDIRDWFASYVYLPRLRDEATLDGAIQRLVSDLAAPYVFASAFDDEKGDYAGVVDQKINVLHKLGDGLLVRREAVRQDDEEADDAQKTTPDGETADEQNKDRKKPVPPEPQPKRFFASVPIESERAGLEVARIMDGLLVELTRTKGSTLRLTLEIEGDAANQGYPKDVVDTVKANVRDLKLDEATCGFEQD